MANQRHGHELYKGYPDPTKELLQHKLAMFRQEVLGPAVPSKRCCRASTPPSLKQYSLMNIASFGRIMYTAALKKKKKTAEQKFTALPPKSPDLNPIKHL